MNVCSELNINRVGNCAKCKACKTPAKGFGDRNGQDCARHLLQFDDNFFTLLLIKSHKEKGNDELIDSAFAFMDRHLDFLLDGAAAFYAERYSLTEIRIRVGALSHDPDTRRQIVEFFSTWAPDTNQWNNMGARINALIRICWETEPGAEDILKLAVSRLILQLPKIDDFVSWNSGAFEQIACYAPTAEQALEALNYRNYMGFEWIRDRTIHPEVRQRAMELIATSQTQTTA